MDSRPLWAFFHGKLAAGVVLGAAFVAHIRPHPDPLVAPRLFSARAFRAGAAGILAYYTGFAAAQRPSRPNPMTR